MSRTYCMFVRLERNTTMRRVGLIHLLLPWIIGARHIMQQDYLLLISSLLGMQLIVTSLTPRFIRGSRNVRARAFSAEYAARRAHYTIE